MRVLELSLLLLLLPAFAMAVPSLVQPVNDAVTVVFDDTGNWGGNMSMNVTHQNAPGYQARKVLDLTDVPAKVWDQAAAVRLSIFLTVHDYSWHDLPAANGLDEAFEVLVNGHSHVIPMNSGPAVYVQNKAPRPDWYDLAIPKSELARGANEIIIHKAPGKIADPQAKPDDYMYLGIDPTRQRGNSSVTFDGTTWTQEKLTIPGGNGEYMVRLYLVTGEAKVQATWQPGCTPACNDPARLLLYAGARGLTPTAEGLKLAAGQAARVEWTATAFDTLEPLRVTVQAQGAPQVQWLSAEGKPLNDPAVTGLAAELPAGRALLPSGLLITAKNGPATIQSVSLSAARTIHPEAPPVNIAPVVRQPDKWPAAQRPSCRMQGNQATLTAGHVQAVFERADTLRLVSLKNLLTGTEMLRHPDRVPLFLVEVADQRYAGSRDFNVADLKAAGPDLTCTLQRSDPTLRAVLTARATTEGLRLGLNVTNVGAAPVDFKVAFPVMAGLAVSAQPADDYYFFPSGGGIINTEPALIRRGYGDYEAMYQVMDVFSPARGCGLSVRALDDQGWHKVLALRKWLPEHGERNEEKLSVSMKPEYKWTNPLEAVEGTSFAYEYERRTRAPLSQAAPAVAGDAASLQKTASFAPADVLLTVHPGDWHVAMQTYADWAHRVWKFRPYPSRLKSIRDMECPGWAHNILFKNGAYRTDFIKPGVDCVELMSWWEWSPLGPFKTPFDKLDTVLTPAQIKSWQPYFVEDPVTGKMMWNNQPGDYKGYNERFGGLPAFQKAVKTYQNMGALVTLYTDPFRLDSNCEIGGKYGEQWGVVGVNGKKTTAYEVWNPCHNLVAVHEWVAETMGRVMRETGADGIRLDEYGHRGYACYDETHKHVYQEPGITQWNKGVADACARIHAEMDKVRPDLVLTTEHPGYDYLLRDLEGCITYDLSSMATPLRPLECNLQRFYFPECKAYELDHRSMDALNRKKFWNTVESFERPFSPVMYALLNENEDVYQGRDNTPLLPTLAPFVYANRFAGAGKTMWHLYNATGHTFEGEALRLSALPAGAHVIELLTVQELPVVNGVVSLYLERDDVACVAILPRVLQPGANGQVKIADGKGGQLVLVSAKGETLLTQDAKGAAATLDLSKLPEGGVPVGVKLLRGGQMVDTAQWQ
jgi:hypothetical protein